MDHIADDFRSWSWPADVRVRLDQWGAPPPPAEPKPEAATSEGFTLGTPRPNEPLDTADLSGALDSGCCLHGLPDVVVTRPAHRCVGSYDYLLSLPTDACGI